MSVTISFELSDSDLEHFQAMAREAQEAASSSGLTAVQIVDAAEQLLAASRDFEKMPNFIKERLEKLSILVKLVRDEEWRLPEPDQRGVLNALAYFADPEDLIPDRVPGIGFLDDAIMAELVAESLATDISAYQQFDAYRASEERRRKLKGLDTHVGREEWLADKRVMLHNRLRELREERMESSSPPIIRLW